MAFRHRYTGSCHCGALGLIFETDSEAGAHALRACDCSFCRRHAVRAVADPQGRAQVLVHDATALRRYRFGLRTADYLLCGACGCYLAALLSDQEGAWATLNVNCLDQREAFAAEAPPVSYDHEDEAGRRARRKALWTPTEVVGEEEPA